jgi:hypothetical protein
MGSSPPTSKLRGPSSCTHKYSIVCVAAGEGRSDREQLSDATCQRHVARASIRMA